MQQYEKILAEFQPLRQDDLQEAARELIGKPLTWMAGWEIEQGAYQGQWAMIPQQHAVGIGWAPLCDLRQV